MLKDKNYELKLSNDIWAIGITFIKLLNSNIRLYSSCSSEDEMIQQIESEYLLTLIPDDISDLLRQIFTACLKMYVNTATNNEK
jgi:serine/threonine protein kinase